MNMWDNVITRVRHEMPKFNDYLLTGYRDEQINRFPVFMHGVFQEAVKLFNGALKYHGYSVVSPERRVLYESGSGLVKGRVNIQRNELLLYEFKFEFDGKFTDVYLYLPYIYEDAIIINDTRFYIRLSIIERMIYRITNGVIVKVMRSPLQFWRSEKFSYISTDNRSFCDTLITTKVHYKKEKTSSSKKIKTPLMLYLLAQFPLEHILRVIFGLPSDSIAFVDHDEQNDEKYIYFKCKDGVYLRAEVDSVMQDISFRRLVASLLYILKSSKRYTISDIYNKTFYKIFLGKNLYGSGITDALAASHAESHLSSLSTYLDQFTKHELSLMQIHCNDIFDLFVSVFVNIDSWLINYSPNDLFEKRLGGSDLVLMNMVKAIFTRFYDTLKKNKVITERNISSMLKMDPMRIKDIYKLPSKQPNASLYNDNTLISTLIKKYRDPQDNNSKHNTNIIGAREHQLHISFMAIESAWGISSSSPGVAGDINPYAVIDSIGCFQADQMPWYEELKPLNKYLVQI